MLPMAGRNWVRPDDFEHCASYIVIDWRKDIFWASKWKVFFFIVCDVITYPYLYLKAGELNHNWN